MDQSRHIGLDNPAFRGRLRQPQLSSPPRQRRSYLLSDVSMPARPDQIAQPAIKELADEVANRQIAKPAGGSRRQIAITVMAAVVFIIGLTVSLQTARTNHDASAQVAALSKKSGPADDPVPDTVKPSDTAVSQYVVAADLPRYLRIPKLGVSTRVMQAGVNSAGELDAPKNVYDAAWYTGSAKPGQGGATLIDGHVSGWSTRGVFYGLNRLSAGDQLQIVRGDGATLSYNVIKKQVYGANNVDMQAAITPVTAGKPGLNLISCTGQIVKGTNRFNERVIVFAEQD